MKLIKNKKNRSRVKKGLIFAGLAGASIALLSQPAIAAKVGKQYHEEEWKKTKTYGNTIIAEDSTTEWGPWKQFIQPAAGPLAIAPMPGMRSDGANYYRPESVEEYSPKYTLDRDDPVAVDTCQGGDWCGYMVQRSTNSHQYQEGPRAGEYFYTKGSSTPTRMTMGFALVDGPEGGTGIVTYGLTELDENLVDDPAGEFYNSGDIPVLFYGSFSHFHDSNDTNFNGHDPLNSEQSTYGSGTSWYGNNDARWGTSLDPDWTGGPFIAGNTSPLADMATRGDITGSIPFNGMAAGGADVVINVDFAAATWNGSWNSGSDGSVATHTDSMTGTTYVTGQVGFNAAGTINGADFSGSATSAVDGDVSGTVIGNFFGSGANTLGGISRVEKETAGYNAVNVDVFVACEGGCNDDI